MNRKLIRTTLAEVKGRESAPTHKERSGSEMASRGSVPVRTGGGGGGAARETARESAAPSGPQGRKKIPPQETNAEIFYYKKQMDAHTLMIIVLTDGEEVEGTIEWYDRAALKINRKDAPNIMLLKHNIKYMFKAEDRGDDEGD